MTSQTGFGNFFLERSVGMYQVPVPPGIQQQQPRVPYPGPQGYGFLPCPRPILNGGSDLKTPSPYHHALLASGPLFYPPCRPPAAKAAARESTCALKAWLHEHLKNPYPTKAEKVMLALLTRMSLTQVSTWFANARRRLKKENRLRWTSRTRSDAEEDEEEEDSDEDKCPPEDGAEPRCVAAEEPDGSAPQERSSDQGVQEDQDSEGAAPGSKSGVSQKPKIWSLVETATSETTWKPAERGRAWVDWTPRPGLLNPANRT